MIRFREHRSTLAASLETAVEFETRAELIAYLQKLWPEWPISDESIEIKRYGFNVRVGQQLYTVTHKTQPGVLGFIYE